AARDRRRVLDVPGVRAARREVPAGRHQRSVRAVRPERSGGEEKMELTATMKRMAAAAPAAGNTTRGLTATFGRLLKTAPLLKDASASGNMTVLKSLLGPAWRGLVQQ